MDYKWRRILPLKWRGKDLVQVEKNNEDVESNGIYLGMIFRNGDEAYDAHN